MINQLHIKNFTAFEDTKFDFAPGLNVIIGSNGSGKTHVLKLAYSLIRTSFESGRQQNRTIAGLQKSIPEDLMSVFMPEHFGHLARMHAGNNNTMVSIKFENLAKADYSFTFSSRSVSEVKLLSPIPKSSAPDWPIFIPAKELLSIFPGLIGLYKNYKLAIDITFPDLCERLDHPGMRGERYNKVKLICEELEGIVGGRVNNENGKFYFYPNMNDKLEIDLVAEGFRKISTLTYLLANGSLTETAPLFWDEPETNLNPLLIKKLAKILFLLSAQNYQIVIATHSLFLLKELHILSKENEVNKVRYFGLSNNKDRNASCVNTTDDLEALPEIVSLEAELEQSDLFTKALEKEYANN